MNKKKRKIFYVAGSQSANRKCGAPKTTRSGRRGKNGGFVIL